MPAVTGCSLNTADFKNFRVFGGRNYVRLHLKEPSIRLACSYDHTSGPLSLTLNAHTLCFAADLQDVDVRKTPIPTPSTDSDIHRDGIYTCEVGRDQFKEDSDAEDIGES